ncbi:MAG TPA: heavy metal-binding domain-containing protein [Bryobacteraceae bacterium]|nr:heavy metal-binding domain-containing protein [Bryobacteraceae bacterium]
MRLLAVALAVTLLAQQPAADDVDFLCPMDKDIRTKQPGKCPRCGMKLVAGIADPLEYPVLLTLAPRAPRPGAAFDLTLRVEDPKTHSIVTKFELVHEKLFHLFLVSEDLQYFAHEHPEPHPNGDFLFRTVLPKAGPYRVAADFYPAGGTPQMHVSTMYVRGTPPPHAPLQANLLPQPGVNLRAELITEPPEPLAGFKTLLFVQLKPIHGAEFQLEPYLGAWGHMLAASEDLIDLIHTHPFIADGGAKVQFNMIFPRVGIYRVWMQFQNQGELNTVAFNIPVKQLR